MVRFLGVGVDSNPLADEMTVYVRLSDVCCMQDGFRLGAFDVSRTPDALWGRVLLCVAHPGVKGIEKEISRCVGAVNQLL